MVATCELVFDVGEYVSFEDLPEDRNIDVESVMAEAGLQCKVESFRRESRKVWEGKVVFGRKVFTKPGKRY